MLDTSCRIAADPEVVACPFGDGLALLDLRSGQYFTTNSVGSFVWSPITMWLPSSARAISTPFCGGW